MPGLPGLLQLPAPAVAGVAGVAGVTGSPGSPGPPAPPGAPGSWSSPGPPSATTAMPAVPVPSCPPGPSTACLRPHLDSRLTPHEARQDKGLAHQPSPPRAHSKVAHPERLRKHAPCTAPWLVIGSHQAALETPYVPSAPSQCPAGCDGPLPACCVSLAPLPEQVTLWSGPLPAHS